MSKKLIRKTQKMKLAPLLLCLAFMFSLAPLQAAAATDATDAPSYTDVGAFDASAVYGAAYSGDLAVGSAFANATSFADANALTAPARIANPRTPDEEFFNMRLDFFLPETEPLIKETFGSELRFEDDAFWEYESYYSRAIGFATNLPTVAKIEFGATSAKAPKPAGQNGDGGQTAAYTRSTEQSDSYYYQHLFHLTGLLPGVEYHYRIIAKDPDGAFIASDDHVFVTPELPAGVVRVPEDLADQSLPYRLETSGVKYLLTRDIYAPHGGILMIAHNIELDLGGHTIVYDTEPNYLEFDPKGSGPELYYGLDSSYGVRGGPYNYTNQKIFNGKIIQGPNGGAGCCGNGYNPIILCHGSGYEVAGVYADYYSDNVNGMIVDVLGYVHHNVVNDRGVGIDNRHSQMRAITVGRSYNGESEICFNSVRRCRQTGISTTNSRQYRNEIYGDSFSANSILLGYNDDTVSYGNKIFGLGYNPQGIMGGNMTNAKAMDNFVYVNAYAPSQRDDEYDRLSGANGFRAQMYEGPDPYVYREEHGISRDSLFENNVVVAKAWPGSLYAVGMAISTAVNQENFRVKNNIIKQVAMFETDIYNDDPKYHYEDLYLSAEPQYYDTCDVVVSGNRFISNTCNVNFEISYNSLLYNNSFERINYLDNTFIPFRIGYWYYDSFNHRVIDSTTGPGVNLSLPPCVSTYYDEPTLRIDVGVSSDRAYVDAATLAPLASRDIRYALDGGAGGVVSTDGAGRAYAEFITTENNHKPGDPGRTMPQTHNSLVTFYANGYDPVVMAISDVAGTGAPILFGAPAAPSPQPSPSPVARPSPSPQPSPSPVARPSPSPQPSPSPITRPSPSPQPSPDESLVVEDLRGGPGLSAYVVNISLWSRSLFDGVEIYRSRSPDGVFELVRTEYGNSAFYDDDLEPSALYFYKARLFRGRKFGPMSDAVAIHTGDLTAEDPVGRANADGTADLSWWSRDDYDYALIYRRDASYNDVFAMYAYTTRAPWFDAGVKKGGYYYYMVRLVKNGHVGAYSKPVGVYID